MKTTFVVAVLVVLLGISVAIPDGGFQGPKSEVEAKKMFNAFLHKYEKFYGVEEFNRRYNIFKKNLKVIEKLNKKNPVHGVTKFADLEPEEFQSIYLATKFSPEEARTHLNFPKSETPEIEIPDSFDWRDHGAVTGVKNQGSCGSCWAFSSTGNMEGQWFLKKGQLVSLSEQNLVDCDHVCDSQNVCDQGCEGGLMWNAFTYVIQNNGIDTEASYPYEGIDDSCRFKSSSVGATITNYTMLSTDEGDMAAWLVSNGPISVAMNADWLQFYVGGVSDPLFCDKKALNHGVLIVGYGHEKTLFGEKDYWLVKNSWGETWGEKGYFKIVRGKDKCGIASVPCSAVV